MGRKRQNRLKNNNTSPVSRRHGAPKKDRTIGPFLCTQSGSKGIGDNRGLFQVTEDIYLPTIKSLCGGVKQLLGIVTESDRVCYEVAESDRDIVGYRQGFHEKKFNFVK